MAALPAPQRAVVAARDADIASLQAALASERAVVAQLRSALIDNDSKRYSSAQAPPSTSTARRPLSSPTTANAATPMWQRSFSEVPAGALSLIAKSGGTLSAVEARRLALRELKAPRKPNEPTREIKKPQFVEWRWKQFVDEYNDEPIQYKLEFNVVPGSVWRLYSKGISESNHKINITFDAGDIKACCLGREVKFRIMYRLLSGGKSSVAYETYHIFEPRPVVFTYGPLSDSERLDLKTFGPDQLYGRVVMRSDDYARKLITKMSKIVHMERYRIHLLDADFTLKDNALVRRISSKNMCVAVLDHPEISLHDYGIPSSTHLHFEPLSLNDGKNHKGIGYAVEFARHHLSQIPGQIGLGGIAGRNLIPSFPVFVGLLNRRCKTSFEMDPLTKVSDLYRMIKQRFGSDRHFRLIFEGKSVEPMTALVTSFGIKSRSQLVADYSDIQDIEMTVVDTKNHRRKVNININATYRDILKDLSLDESHRLTIMQIDMTQFGEEEGPRTLAELGVTFEETLFVDPLICVWDGEGLPINIRMASGRISKLLMRNITTVRTLKSFIQGQEGIALAEQRLLLNGAQLESDRNVDRTMIECKVVPDTVLTLVLRVLFKQNQSPITSGTGGVTKVATTPGVGVGVGTGLASPSSDVSIAVADDDEELDTGSL